MAKKVVVDLDFNDAKIINFPAATANGHVVEYAQLNTALATKHQSLSSTGTIEVDGASLNVILSEEGATLDQITVSGETSYFNVAYNIVKNSSGVKLKARFNQSGATLHYNAAPEAMQKLTLDCTNNNLDVQVSVLKYTGYLIRSGDNFTWATGSTGGEFHYYYWNSTDKIFVAYCATDSEWIAVDLDNATNATDFIADLNATGSQAGYITGGETFTATSSHRELIGSAKDDYVDDTAAHVPASSLAKVTHSGDADWTEYFYMDSTSRKILGYDDENGYWALWLLSADADFSSEPADNASFSMTASGAFDLITTSSDDYGDGINIPDAGHSNITYSGTAGSVPYLNTTSGLAVEVEETLAGTANKIASSAAVKTYVDEIDANANALIALSGVAENAENLGTFSGSTIADNSTVKAALQALENEAEANNLTVHSGSSSLLSISGNEISVSNLLVSSVTVDDTQTSLANYITNESSDFAAMGEGDILILSNTALNEVYIHNGGSAGNANDMTAVQLDLNATTVKGLFSAGAGLTYSNGVFSVGADQIKDTMIDFGTGATQINSGDIPLETYSWARITNPADVGDALEKLDADLASVAGGAISINNGVATNGEDDGSVDVRVDDASIEVNGSNNLAVKALGIASGMIAADAVVTAKILDANVTTAKIADANVTTAKILDANVTTAKLADDAVTADKLASNAVVDASIVNGTITAAKLADDYMVRVLATGTWTADEAKVITHNLGSKYVHVTVYDSNDSIVIPDVVGTSTSTATITISAAGDYSVVISG